MTTELKPCPFCVGENIQNYEYKVIEWHHDIRNLEREVNAAINDGWVPYGPVTGFTSIGLTANHNHYLQAMIRRTGESHE